MRLLSGLSIESVAPGADWSNRSLIMRAIYADRGSLVLRRCRLGLLRVHSCRAAYQFAARRPHAARRERHLQLGRVSVRSAVSHLCESALAFDRRERILDIVPVVRQDLLR